MKNTSLLQEANDKNIQTHRCTCGKANFHDLIRLQVAINNGGRIYNINTDKQALYKTR